MNKVYGTLVYVSVQEPVAAYEKDKPKEWKASVVLADEEKVDELEEFAKSVGAKISLKKVKTTEFEEQFRIPAPEGAGRNVWVFTLRRSTELGKSGNPVPDEYRPRVYEQKGNTLVDVTMTKLVGNGSKGAISIDNFVRKDGTSSLYLKNVLVKELVEYNREEKQTNGSEFDDDVTQAEPAKPAKTEKQTKAVKPPKDEVPDDDIPF